MSLINLGYYLINRFNYIIIDSSYIK